MALPYEVIPYGKHVQDAYGATARHTALFKMRLQIMNLSVDGTFTIPWPQSHTGCLIQCLDYLRKRCRQPDHTELVLFISAIILKGPQQTGHHQ